MATAVESPSELEILSDVLDLDHPTFGPDLARWLLGLKFKEWQRARMMELADKGNRGELSVAEQAELDRYRRAGMLINLLQARAHLSLQPQGHEG
jgi:hypothetical protein